MSKIESLVRLTSLEKRSLTIKNKKIAYDAYVKANKSYYIEKLSTLPFIDEYDNKQITTLCDFNKKKLVKGISTNAKCCICCSDYEYDELNIKHTCNNRKCFGLFNAHKETYTEKFGLDICNFGTYLNILHINPRHLWHKYSFDESYNLYLELKERYILDDIRKIFMGLAFIHKDELLYVKPANKNKTVSLYAHGFYEDCLFRICNACGDTYLYEDKILLSDGQMKFKKVGALYNCKKTACYHKVMHMHIRDDESHIRQSNKIKELIRSGKFTPCVTNSWAKSRCYIDNNTI